jgi:hypothetical protein
MDQHQQEENAALPSATNTDAPTLPQEAAIEAYLMGRLTRQEALKQLGPERLEEIEYQRDALKRDVAWGAQQAAGDD